MMKKQGPSRPAYEVELATLNGVWRLNKQRLDPELDEQTSAEVEAPYCAGKGTL